jgi:hypothetical protein
MPVRVNSPMDVVEPTAIDRVDLGTDERPRPFHRRGVEPAGSACASSHTSSWWNQLVVLNMMSVYPGISLYVCE